MVVELTREGVSFLLLGFLKPATSAPQTSAPHTSVVLYFVSMVLLLYFVCAVFNMYTRKINNQTLLQHLVAII